MLNLNDLILPVVAVVPVIMGMVEFLKKFGLDGEKLTAASFVVGAVIALMAWAYVAFPATQIYIQGAFIVLVGGMTACGLYDLGKKWTTN